MIGQNSFALLFVLICESLSFLRPALRQFSQAYDPFNRFSSSIAAAGPLDIWKTRTEPSFRTKLGFWFRFLSKTSVLVEHEWSLNIMAQRRGTESNACTSWGGPEQQDQIGATFDIC